ncbi:hypothetical protein [Candidatus Methylocalor cossyra]|uniref:Lipoprotein n=1 Tax=Candidatus Methylocalor cossyra TaxID=3108543 RepID=A0ABP1C4N1_9GAMM
MRPLLKCAAVALCLAFGLAGCVWLRLLEVKNQLAEFDQNLRVQVVHDYFIVHFLHPVLLSDDFIELAKLRPSRVATLPEGYRWFLDFRMEGGKGRNQPGKTLVFAMTFTPEDRLAAFEFSPLFLQMAPPAFLEASLRSLGRGKVDQGKQQLKVDPEDLPKLSARLPDRRTILAVLGPPVEQSRQDDLLVLLYRFKADAEPVEPEYESRRLAEAKLFFDPAKDELVRLAGRFAGLKLSIDYRKLIAAPPQDRVARHP